MPVDQKILEQCISEAAGDDAEMATFLRERYSKNDALAAKFVGGFMRNSDYTAKTQELATQRKQFESQSGELANVRKALEAAEQEKAGILKEVAGQRISVAKARELMKLLQEKYQLTDDDLPGMSDLIETRKTGKPVDTTEDLDARLASLKSDLMKQMEEKFVTALKPELGAMARLGPVWRKIEREHFELTGKELTFEEQEAIFKKASESGVPLVRAWEESYQISGDDGLRMKKRDEKLKQSWEQEQERLAADRASKAALERVSPVEADLGKGPGISAAFKTRFKTFDPDPGKPAIADPGGIPTLEVKPGQHVKQTGDRGPSAAQRAAAKFLESRKTA